MHAHRRRSSEAVDPFLRPALQPWARAGPHHLELSSHHARADGSEAITWDDNISGFPRSGGRTQPHTFGHDAVAREAPERDQQLAGPARRSMSCASTGHPPFAADTIGRAHYPSGTGETARLTGSYRAAPARCPSGPIPSPRRFAPLSLGEPVRPP